VFFYLSKVLCKPTLANLFWYVLLLNVRQAERIFLDRDGTGIAPTR
jgi:hypothetical protein